MSFSEEDQIRAIYEAPDVVDNALLSVSTLKHVRFLLYTSTEARKGHRCGALKGYVIIDIDYDIDGLERLIGMNRVSSPNRGGSFEWITR